MTPKADVSAQSMHGVFAATSLEHAEFRPIPKTNTMEAVVSSRGMPKGYGTGAVLSIVFKSLDTDVDERSCA